MGRVGRIDTAFEIAFKTPGEDMKQKTILFNIILDRLYFIYNPKEFHRVLGEMEALGVEKNDETKLLIKQMKEAAPKEEDQNENSSDDPLPSQGRSRAFDRIGKYSHV